jgi:Ca2+-binding RTX toxin-like protein
VARIRIDGTAASEWFDVAAKIGPVADGEIYAGDGNDGVWGGTGADWIHGGNGNDQLWGNAGDDKLYGDEGNDQLYGGEGTAGNLGALRGSSSAFAIR